MMIPGTSANLDWLVVVAAAAVAVSVGCLLAWAFIEWRDWIRERRRQRAELRAFVDATLNYLVNVDENETLHGEDDRLHSESLKRSCLELGHALAGGVCVVCHEEVEW